MALIKQYSSFLSAAYLIKIKNMKNYMYSSIVLFFISIQVFGQSPSWAVNENNFQYTMSIVSFVNVDGQALESANDKVAAFVNGECRGIANLTYVESENSYYAYLTIFSNQNSEVLNFKIYDSVNDEIKEVSETKTFEINEHYGNLFQAYSIANPALSNSADILDFNFGSIAINDKSINSSEVVIDVDKEVDITVLNTFFELSEGAKLFIGNTGQISGSNLIDFSNPIQFQVRSEDQTVLKQWSVTVNKSIGTVIYYKKDAVCYTGGVIKVLFTENNVEAYLIKDGEVFATQTIYNGEALFSNLQVGTYKVKVSGNNKEIVINLKE